MKNNLVVKRHGHAEKFDERKVYESVYAACASAHMHKTSCEEVAEEICKKLKKWLKGKKEVDSRDIRKKVGQELKKKDEEIFFFYEQHLPNLKKL